MSASTWQERTLDEADGAISTQLRAAALGSSSRLMVLDICALSALAQELGDPIAAAVWLQELADERGKPLVLLGEMEGRPCTGVVAPRSWSPERVLSWGAGKREELETLVGPIVEIRQGGRRVR